MSGGPSRSARQAAAQQLSSLRSAGVSRVSSRSRRHGEPKPEVEPVPEKASTPAATPCPRSASLFGSAKSSTPRVEREEKLRILASRVAQCTRCAELSETRTQTVFGVGNPEAKLMFLGEAPGADEDRQGEPFVGAAGQLLNRILEACKLNRSDVYICNILRCLPPGNRTPAPEEAANCREYLDGQIEVIDPDYIVCLGSVAAKNLLGSME